MNLGPAVFSGVVLLVGLVYGGMALRMPRGSLAYPGPGLFPLAVGALLVATSLGCLAQELRAWRRGRSAAPAPPSAAPEAAPERDRARTVALTALLAGYVLLLKTLGFPLAICAFLAAAIRIFGYRRWAVTLAVALLVTACSYVAFVHWLKVPLPMGLLEDILG
ncbi:MAG: tripartite tricarboxylate transporter TctB family protein [Deltaproteobacteria bacterium]|nr:tripartite tricarboxylate transporter TctB family protein [Deltaproteobacteria bacterium]